MDIRKWLSPTGGKQAKPPPKRKATIATDDEDDAFTGKRKKVKASPDKATGLSCKKEISRKRINYIDSSDSDGETTTRPAAKKAGSTSRYFDSSRSSEKSSHSDGKKGVSASSFFSDTAVKQTPAKKKPLGASNKQFGKTVIPETPPKDIPGSGDIEDPLDDPDFTEALLEASDAALPVALESPEKSKTPAVSSPRKSARLQESPIKHGQSHLKVSSSSPKKAANLVRSPKCSPARPSSVASPTKALATVEPSAKADVCTLRKPAAAVKMESPRARTAGQAKPKALSSSAAVADSAPAKTPTSTPSKPSKLDTPASKNPPADDEDVSPAPMKRNRSFYEYKNREGPRNVGSRTLPEGADNCLGGLTFIVTGVLEYAEREDAQELVTRHGGKLTQTVGKRTSYMVVGREPGPAKIEKANKLGIKQLTEDEFFDLIETSPAKSYDSGASQAKGGKPSNKKAIILGAPADDEIPAVTVKKQEKPAAAAVVKKPAQGKGSGNRVASSSLPSSMSSSRAASAASTDGGSSSKLSTGSTAKPSSSSDSAAPESVLWVDKYRPRTLKQLIGQQGDRSNMNKLLKWLRNWHRNLSVRPDRDSGAGFRAALLSGPPGIGKTTTATLVCQEAGFHYVELNASDTRSKNSLQTVVAQSLDNQTINGMLQTANQRGKDGQQLNALLMDEVDGMAGNEDRGGMQELVALIKSTKTPIICMCNDRNSQKIRTLSNYCYDLRFQRPRVEQIRGAMLSVACREGISIKPPALDVMINAANHDIRQVLHHMYLWTIRDRTVSYDQAKEDSAKAEKHMKMSPFEVIRKVFAPETAKKTITDQMGLFFQDYSLMPLFVQEMYPKVRPYAANSQLKTLDCLAAAAESISQSDLVDKRIRSSQSWGLLQLQGMLSTVVPGSIMRGALGGQIEFPSWLGKRSKQTKCERLLQEISLHSRLTTSVSKVDLGLDMVPHLHKSIVRPLVSEGPTGVPDSVEKMIAYSFLREDLDSLSELCTYPPKVDPFSKLDSKVKSAFTRHYNKTAPNTTFSVTGAVLSKRKGKTAAAGAAGDGLLDAEGEDESVDNGADSEEEVDVAALLQKKKPKTAAASGGAASKSKPGRKAASGAGSSSARGRGRAAKKR